MPTMHWLCKGWTIDQVGDLIPASTSTGIVLGATSNVAANTLDDYEEGTFTPNLMIQVMPLHITTRVGDYTKIGDMFIILST